MRADGDEDMMKRGVPISAGVAVARAYVVDDVLGPHEPQPIDLAAVSGEINRFNRASASAAAELDALIARVSKEIGEEEANIFRSHRLLLRDPALMAKVRNAIINRHVDAATALREALDEYTLLFSQIQNEYLRERMNDNRNVVGRLLSHLALEETRKLFDPDEKIILVASEILPSQTFAFQRMRVAGILTETGASTGHAAILARSLGIPAVSGLRDIRNEVRNGDLVAVDGREGHVYINPGPEVESAYRKLQREFVDLRDRLIDNRDEEPVTVDGTRVELLTNVNSMADARLAVQVGADGVGLYRTEYLFLTHASVPTEEEQYAAYR